MLKKTFILIVLLISQQAFAMREGPYFLCRTDSNGDVWVNDGHGGQVKATFDKFMYSLDETRNEDDTQKLVRVKQPLFVQLCVQAAKSNFDQKPFHELLAKIKSGAIHMNAEQIELTKKDGKHRLLSYIPSSNGLIYSLVNNKKIQILIQGFETEQDKIYNAPLAEAYKKHKNESSNDEEGGWITRGYRPPFTPKYSGNEIYTPSNDVAADKAHHEQVVAEFKILLSSESEQEKEKRVAEFLAKHTLPTQLHNLQQPLAEAQSNGPSPINWPALTSEIKNDLYRMLVQEKSVGGINYLEMANGNSDLANDIKQLYNENNSCQEAQQKINLFCKKWNVVPFAIADEEDDE